MRARILPGGVRRKLKVGVPDLFRRGAVAADRSDLVQAERLYREILAARPGQPRALHSLGILIYQCGRHEEALSLIEQLLVQRPDFAGAHYALGTMLQNLGRVEPALASLDKALAQSPNDRHALQNRGVPLAALKRYEAAVPTSAPLIRTERKGIPGHHAVSS